MKRQFEKISYDQFKKDIKADRELYCSYLLPQRKTKQSVGYDFIAMTDFTIKPGERLIIPTGYKARFNSNEMLMIVVRSSMGFKFNIRLCNQVGIIESDYYNNQDNEGHLMVALQNEGTKVFKIKQNDAYAQGIFIRFLTCGDRVVTTRTGGFGSTNQKKENSKC